MGGVEDYCQEVNSYIGQIEAPADLKNVATSKYREYINPDNAYTRSPKLYALAAIYLAARLEQYPLVVQDLEAEDFASSQIWQAFRHMCSELEIQPDTHNPNIFVDRIHDEFPYADDQISSLAKELLSSVPSAVNGKRPNAIAAGAYYSASIRVNNRIKQDLIADAANVSNLTIRKRYEGIDQKLREA